MKPTKCSFYFSWSLGCHVIYVIISTSIHMCGILCFQGLHFKFHPSMCAASFAFKPCGADSSFHKCYAPLHFLSVWQPPTTTVSSHPHLTLFKLLLRPLSSIVLTGLSSLCFSSRCIGSKQFYLSLANAKHNRYHINGVEAPPVVHS